MNLTLIPLFLAATVSVNENDWKYGPEVIYDATIEYATHPYPEQNTGVFSTTTITTKLNCRPKSRLVLSCSFHEPHIVAKMFGLFSAPREIANILGKPKNNDSNENTFEANFGKNGLESIVISISESYKIDMIRTLIGQLNIGGDLSNVSGDKFELLEHFTTGSCITNYVVSARSLNDEEFIEDKRDRDPYDITMLIGKEMPPGEIKQIMRTRNLETCGYPANYIFRTFIQNRGTTLDKKIKSSKSLMTLRNGGFNSWTEYTVIARMKQNSSGTSITTMQTEKTTLKLDKIVPASGQLATIRNPAIINIFPTPDFDDSDIENPPETHDFRGKKITI